MEVPEAGSAIIDYGKYTAQWASKPHQTSAGRTQSQYVPLLQQSKPPVFSRTRQRRLIDATALRIALSTLPAPALNAGGSFPEAEAQGRSGGCQGPQPGPSGQKRSADSSAAAPRPLTRVRARPARSAGNFPSGTRPPRHPRANRSRAAERGATRCPGGSRSRTKVPPGAAAAGRPRTCRGPSRRRGAPRARYRRRRPPGSAVTSAPAPRGRTCRRRGPLRTCRAAPAATCAAPLTGGASAEPHAGGWARDRRGTGSPPPHPHPRPLARRRARGCLARRDRIRRQPAPRAGRAGRGQGGARK